LSYTRGIEALAASKHAVPIRMNPHRRKHKYAGARLVTIAAFMR
jgi:hypothetical protein